MRTISFIAIGSMMDVESASRLFTATNFPSGETAIWCGSFPTGIFATSANWPFGAPSRTHTCSVFSLATNTRSLLYCGPDGGAAVADTPPSGGALGRATSVGGPGDATPGSSAPAVAQAPMRVVSTPSPTRDPADPQPP